MTVRMSAAEDRVNAVISPNHRDFTPSYTLKCMSQLLISSQELGVKGLSKGNMACVIRSDVGLQLPDGLERDCRRRAACWEVTKVNHRLLGSTLRKQPAQH